MKKIEYFNLIAVLILSILIFTECKQDKKMEKETINIVACGINNPQWLTKKIDSLVNLYSNTHHLYEVYSIIRYKQEYVMIYDPANSCYVCIYTFFTCTGELVETETALYSDLISLFNDGKRTLLQTIWTD
jgi:hypothetical protein